MSRLNVRYILFCHYNDSNEAPLEKLKRFQDELNALLDDQNYPGLLILFWHPGWLELLNTVGADFNPHEFASEFRKSEDAQQEVKKLLDKVHMRVPRG